MSTQWLLLAALIVSALRPATSHDRQAVPTRRVTIVERVRSEFLSVLIGEPGAAEDVTLPAAMRDPDLTRVDSAPATDRSSHADGLSATRTIEEAGGLRRPHSRFPRGGMCWWLWLLFGAELCGDPVA